MRKILSLTCYLFLLNACTSLPDVIKNIPVIDVPYSVVTKDIDAYKNKQVRWGGVIIQTETEKEMSFVQILFYPLDSSGYPRLNQEPEGRFIIASTDFLDPAIYAKDRVITVAGMLSGSVERAVGNKKISIPFLLAKAIYLWPKDYRRFYMGDGRYPYFYHPGFYGYPFFYPGYYGPYRYWR